jgi:peptide deformylase
MPIQKLKTNRQIYPRPCRMIFNFQDKYLLQSVNDLLDTLANMQKEYDLLSPDKGMGVALSSDQIEYPYEPVSIDDPAPRTGFYPKDFQPYRLYVLSIRPERAVIEKCVSVPPTVFYNAKYNKLSNLKHRQHHDWSIKRGTILVSGVEGGNEDYFTTLDTTKNQLKTDRNESCASVYGVTGLSISRYKHIEINHITADNKLVLTLAEGFVARLHQHAVEHTDGDEYLKQLNLTSEEVSGLINWVKINSTLSRDAISRVIIPNKLTCEPAAIDFDALGNWARTELSRRWLSNQDQTAGDLRLFGTDFNATRLLGLTPAIKQSAFSTRLGSP